jgi:hypothetical protein
MQLQEHAVEAISIIDSITTKQVLEYNLDMIDHNVSVRDIPLAADESWRYGGRHLDAKASFRPPTLLASQVEF